MDKKTNHGFNYTLNYYSAILYMKPLKFGIQERESNWIVPSSPSLFLPTNYLVQKILSNYCTSCVLIRLSCRNFVKEGWNVRLWGVTYRVIIVCKITNKFQVGGGRGREGKWNPDYTKWLYIEHLRYIYLIKIIIFLMSCYYICNDYSCSI